MRSAMNMVVSSFLVLLLPAGPSEAQSRSGLAVSGRVSFLGAAQPIGAIRVELQRLGLTIQEQVSFDDRFEFSEVLPGSYTVVIHAADYATVTRDIQVPGDYEVRVQLRPSRGVEAEDYRTASVAEYQVPGSARRQFKSAQKKLRRDDCPGALEHLRKAIEIFGAYADARNAMGNCYVVLKDLKLAEEAFKQAVSRSSSVYPALNLADLYSRQGRMPEAEEVLTKAIRRSPSEGDGYYGLALIRFEQGRLEEAAQLCLQAHQHPHRVADVHLLLGKIDLRQGKPLSAVHELRLYVAEARPNPVRDRVMKLLEDTK